MAAWIALQERARVPLVALSLAVAALSGVASGRAAEPVDTIIVRLDQARITRMPDKVSTIVVGNPLIADVTLQTGGLLVLTGKGYGVTNVVALDRAGAVLSEFVVQVDAASDTVVVYRGDARESYSCMPDCMPRVSLGDAGPYFTNTMNQTVLRTGRSQAAGSPSSAAR